MDVLSAVSVGLSLATAGLDLINKSGTISQLIAKAQSEGRTSLTQEEWDSVIKMDDDARDKLAAAIKAAGG